MRGEGMHRGCSLGIVCTFLVLSGCIASAAGGPQAPAASLSVEANAGEVSTIVPVKNELLSFAIDRQDRVYLALESTIRRYPSSEALSDLASGEPLMTDVRFPWAIAVAPDGAVWVLDGLSGLHRRGPDGSRLNVPLPDADSWNTGLAVDATGNAYVAMNRNGWGNPTVEKHYIARVTPDGTIAPFAGSPDAGSGFADGQGAAARFNGPTSLAFDGAGNLYVADSYAIRRVSPAGGVTTVTGKGAPSLPPSPMPGLPPTDLAPFYEGRVSATGLTLDANGTLYFSSGNRIHRLTADGVQSVLAGDGKQCRGIGPCMEDCPPPESDPCDRDGPGPTARFFNPSLLATDRRGAVYVMDQGTLELGRRLRRIR